MSTPHPGGMLIEEVVVGSGAAAAAGRHVTVHYTGWLFENGAAGFQINPYYARMINLIGINVTLAVSLNLINGLAGQFSIGHPIHLHSARPMISSRSSLLRNGKASV